VELMPMIDVYAPEGTFGNTKDLAQRLAEAVMRWEQVPPLALFKDNTAAFVHDIGRFRELGSRTRAGGHSGGRARS
jgi:hypothetical protein